jgi:hypothetical protein
MSICHILALVIQQAKHISSAPNYIDSRGLSDSTMFFHIISQPAPFWGGEVDTEQQMCILIFSTTFV